MLRIYEKKPLVADQVAVNYRKADISDRAAGDARVRDEGLRTTRPPSATPTSQTLRGHGFGDEDIWDIAGITALFGLSNRMANFTSMRPNDEFYLMGRVPKAKT